MSLTEALRTGAPQAFEALYDEYSGAVYAYCHAMVGDEAGDVLHDAFVSVARHPGAAPGDDVELPVWLHSLARAECVRRGALLRGVVTTGSADPLRRALALLSPEHRDVLALSNALDTEQTAQVLRVTRDTAETLVREARRLLEQAADSVAGPDSAMLAPLSGEALHRLVTLGYEPPAGTRERVLSSCAASGRAAAFDAETSLRPDAFSAPADAATHPFPRISPDEAATAPLHRIDGISAGARPDRSGLPGAAPAGSGSAAGEAVSAESAESPTADTGEPPTRGAHAKRSKPFPGRRLIPVVGLVACVAAATGAALAWPGSHHTEQTGALVRQSARPGRPARPTPSGDQGSPPLKATTSDPSRSPTPARTAATPTAASSPSGAAPAEGSGSTTPTPTPTRTRNWTLPIEPDRPIPPAEPTRSVRPPIPTTRPGTPTTRPRPHHTTEPGDAPADGHPTTGRQDLDRACDGTAGQASRCAWPRPWRPRRPGDSTLR